MPAMNAWSGETVASGSVSDSFDINHWATVTVAGSGSTAATITLQFSHDNSHFFNGPTAVLSGSGDFYINASVGARFIRLRTSAAITIYAVMSVKT